VKTPPKTGISEIIHVWESIYKRRRSTRNKAEGPHLEELPVIDNQARAQHVHDVLDYLGKYPHRTPGFRHADNTAALYLDNWLWWDAQRRRRDLLRRCIREGMFLAQIGSPLGIGKQGVNDQLDRLDALLRFDRPDEQLIREIRRKERLESVETDWITAHRDALLTLIDDLVAEADRWQLDEDDRTMLDELAQDAQDERDEDTADGFSPSTMSLLNLAVLEISTAQPVAELSTTPQANRRPYTVHEVLRAADQLRHEFADLGRINPPPRSPRKRSPVPRLGQLSAPDTTA
jgi:hypothetical protein